MDKKTPLKLPNKVQLSHLLLSANHLCDFAKTIERDVPRRDGILDDETLGIDWALDSLKRAKDAIYGPNGYKTRITALGNNNGKGQNIYLTPIAPGEDVIDWANANFEKIGETFVNKDAVLGDLKEEILDLGQIFYKLTGHHCLEPNKSQLQVIAEQLEAYVNNVKQKLHDKDVTAKELSDQINIVGDYILRHFPDDIREGGTMDVMIELLSDLKLKRAVCDDSIKQFNEAHKQVEELKNQLTEKDNVLKQARENLAILQPHPGNFDQLLTLVLQYVVNSRKLLTEDQRKLLSSINALI